MKSWTVASSSFLFLWSAFSAKSYRITSPMLLFNETRWHENVCHKHSSKWPQLWHYFTAVLFSIFFSPTQCLSLSLAHCFRSLKCQDPLKANLILASCQLFAHIQWDFCIEVGNKYMPQNGANDAGKLWQENPLPTLGRYKTKSWSA